jgi:predicted permease
MAAHLAMLEDEFRHRGLSEEDAKRAARRKFGPMARARDLHREARSFMWIEELQQDLRYTFRSLAASKVFAATAILTLALGIGANSAVFSVIYPLMIEPLPFDHPGQLVQLVERGSPTDWTGGALRRYPLPPNRIAELVDETEVIAGLFQGYGFATTLVDVGDATTIRFGGVSAGMFSTLRTRPLLGRLLQRGDYEPGAQPVTIISYDAWQRYWRGESDVIGRTATLDTQSGRQRFRIVGVLSENFSFPIDAGSAAPETEFWAPGDFSGHGTGSGLTTVLRVREDTTVQAAAAEVRTLLDAMEIQSAHFDPSTGEVGFAPAGVAELVPIKARQIEHIRSALLVLIATVAAVLLMACTNVANLMLGRSAARKQEIAIRSSLGATSGRLVRQVLTESFVLCMAGGFAGMIVAFGGIRLMSAWPGNARPGASGPLIELPRIDGVELDGTVVLFTFGIALLTGLLFGLGPALSLRRRLDIEGLKDRASARSASKRTRAGGGALIVAQVALAMTLLVGAGLLMQSFLALVRVDPGFSADGVMTFQVTASRAHFRDTPPYGGGVAYFEDLAHALRQLPGVRAAGFGPPPFQFRGGNGVNVRIPGSPGEVVVSVLDVSDGYLEGLGIRLLEGRVLSAADRSGGALAVIVNRAFVRQHLDGRDAVGMLVQSSFGRSLERPSGTDAEIVGVVDDVRRGGLDSDPYPQLFVDYRHAAELGNVDYWWTSFAVRTSEPGVVSENAAAIVRRFDPDARVENILPLDEIVTDSIMASRFFANVCGIFALIGLTLALVGLYGVVSYAVTQRTKEIGIRMALGARRPVVLSMVLRHAARLVLTGIAAGFLMAFASGRYLESLLFGVEPFDAQTFVVVAVAFLFVAVVAALVPALRAADIDPIVSLREQ